MQHHLKKTLLLLSLVNLYSCSAVDNYLYDDRPPPMIQKGTELYPEGYEATNYPPADYDMPRGPVTVPESYHVGIAHPPVKSKNVDEQWAAEQNSSNYTIEVAHDEKPATVAKKLLNVPKSERRAEIEYQDQGKKLYRGVYGSYPTKEAAEEAMKNLPEDVKQNANVQSWENIKKNMD